jgi:hypothetical protein
MRNHNVIGFAGAMKPHRRLRTKDHAYRRRDPRKSGEHPVDWVLVAALLGLLAVAAAGWMR